MTQSVYLWLQSGKVEKSTLITLHHCNWIILLTVGPITCTLRALGKQSSRFDFGNGIVTVAEQFGGATFSPA